MTCYVYYTAEDRDTRMRQNRKRISHICSCDRTNILEHFYMRLYSCPPIANVVDTCQYFARCHPRCALEYPLEGSPTSTSVIR